MTKRKYKVLKEFRLDEISLVDHPAQPDAKIILMKRADQDEIVEKKAALTTAEEGHTHLVALKFRNGTEIRAGETSWANGHTHPWVVTESGDLTIGEADGHIHEIDVISKVLPKRRAGESQSDFVSRFMGNEDMKREFPERKQRLAVAYKQAGMKKAADAKPEGVDNADGNSGDQADIGTVQGNEMTKNDQTVDAVELQKRLEKAEARAERAERVAGLSPSQREHFEKMEDEAQDEFLELESSDRDQVVAKALEDDKVVYTTEDGEVFRKSDDPRLVALAKRADEERKARIEAESVAKAQDLQKRAAELQHLPGEDKARIALLKAIDGLEGEEKEQALAMLKAHDQGLNKAFERQGVRGKADEGSPEATITKMAKDIQKDNPELSLEQAEARVLKTPQGRKLYRDMVGL